MPTPITQFDIIRSLPFGGGISEADMRGTLLIKVLEAGRKNIGTGGFLISFPAQLDTTNNIWIISGKGIDPLKTYRVAMTEFLFSGKEANLGFLKKDNADIVKVYETNADTKNPKSDIRLAVIRYLEKKK